MAAARSQLRSFSTLLASRSLPRAASSSFAQLAGQQGQSSVFRRCLSNDTRSKIQKAVEADPLVIFMKGTPQVPQCGFSKAVIQIMEVQGIPENKMQTYNCLEVRAARGDQGVLRLAYHPSGLPQGRVHWRMRPRPRNAPV